MATASPGRPSLTVGRLMFGVAIAGLALGWSAWMHRRAALFEAEAARHLEVWLTHSPTSPTRPDPRPAYHAEMSAKYEWAARHPWLPVEPDLPEPE